MKGVGPVERRDEGDIYHHLTRFDFRIYYRQQYVRNQYGTSTVRAFGSLVREMVITTGGLVK